MDLLLLLSALVTVCSAQPRLYPFGPDVNDNEIDNQVDDLVVGPIMIQNGVFPFVGENITELYVSPYL